MQFIPAAVLVLLTCVASLGTTHGGKHGKIGALYFMDNDPYGNSVVTLDIYHDGSIKVVSKFSTGAKGASAVNGNATEGPDALDAQGPVTTTGGKYLFAVNAGSNTVSMFKIDRKKPTKLEFICEEATGGEFPVSVAFNEKHKVACVLNGGIDNGIRCFSVSDAGLSPFADRYLGENITTPPSGPPNTVSHILFDESGDNVIVSVKGIPSAQTGGTPVKLGYVASYAVGPGKKLAAEPVKTIPDGGLLPFGMALIPGTTSVLVADPGVGVTVYDYKAGGKVPASTVSTTIPGQMATCWTVYSPKTGSYFVSDIGASTLVELAVNAKATAASIVQTVTNFDPSVGPLEMAVASTKSGPDYLFLLGAGSQSIQMYKLYGKGVVSPVTAIDLKPQAAAIGLNLTTYVEGMALVMKKH